MAWAIISVFTLLGMYIMVPVVLFITLSGAALLAAMIVWAGVIGVPIGALFIWAWVTKDE